MKYGKKMVLITTIFSTSFLLTSEYFDRFDDISLFKKIIKILFLPMVLVNFLLSILLLIISLIGKIILLIPILDFIYLGIAYLLLYISGFITFIFSFANPKLFIEDAKGFWHKSYNDSLSKLTY